MRDYLGQTAVGVSVRKLSYMEGHSSPSAAALLGLGQRMVSRENRLGTRHTCIYSPPALTRGFKTYLLFVCGCMCLHVCVCTMCVQVPA